MPHVTTPYFDLLTELRRRQMAVTEQQIRVDRFVLNLLRSTNFATNPSPKPRTKSKVVPGFVLDALNAIPHRHN